MTSARKAAANRNNALRSTGPKSLTGLSHSCRNALKSGIYAHMELLPGEDAAAYKRLRKNAFSELKPSGIIERTFFELIVGDLWRLGRLQHVENAILREAEGRSIERSQTSWFESLSEQGLERLINAVEHEISALDGENEPAKTSQDKRPIDPAESLLTAHLSKTDSPKMEELARLRRATTRDLANNIGALKALQKERRTVETNVEIEAVGTAS